MLKALYAQIEKAALAIEWMGLFRGLEKKTPLILIQTKPRMVKPEEIDAFSTLCQHAPASKSLN